MDIQRRGTYELMLSLMDRFDPEVCKLALERLLSGEQLYAPTTHKLRPEFSDEKQARAVILVSRMLAKAHGVKLRLSSDEKRNLSKISENPDRMEN